MGHSKISYRSYIFNGMDKKIFSRYKTSRLSLPELAEIQINSYKWFFKIGLKELFGESSPIKEEFGGQGLAFEFADYYLDEPKYTEAQARENNLSYEAPLRVRVRLTNSKTKEVKEQEVYLGDFPLMTPRGTFVVNGVERVVVSQLIRSSGVYFTAYLNRGRKLFGAKVIPNRGAWLEFETDSDGAIQVKIDRKRKVPASVLLRIFGVADNNAILELFKDIDTGEIQYMQKTLERDSSKNADEAFIEIYRRIRPGDLAAVDNARSLIRAMFGVDRYDLAEVGRFKLNQRLGFKKNVKDPKDRVLGAEEITAIIREIIRLNSSSDAVVDDIDHLGNRRVRCVGELLQNKLRVGVARMARIVKDRMSTLDPVTLTPAQLVNARPFMASVKEFFTSSQLSQFMDQINPLSELEHKRRLSAMGPGGLQRERAGFEVRDVHPSHYGRICPIQTPEGPNIGLVGQLSLYAKISPLGFILPPYRKVKNGRVTEEVVYLDASEEEGHIIAQAGVKLDAHNKIIEERIPARIHGEAGIAELNEIDLMDVSPKQPFSGATSLIPFLEHDDANRALMGSNMQRQAEPLIKPQAPLVGTGLEEKVARDSGRVVVAAENGTVDAVDASHITVKTEKGEKIRYDLSSFVRSNAFTAITQKPLVRK